MSVINYDDIRQRFLTNAKDEDISPFTFVDKLSGFNAGKLKMDERINLSMSDPDLVPLLVQENYINYRPSSAGKDDSGIKRMNMIARAAESIADADIVNKEFEKIFSQAKYEAASCGGGSECSPLDPSVEEKIRNQSWFTAASGRNKGRVYGVGKVQAGYRCGDNFTQPTTSFASSEKITLLEEKVRKTQEENEKLS
ncbi:hypothetical protein Fmac_005298 [Flemingia macrophylla]|uniref:Uncharacterized protein n=1 Tax=Flemingia macrophylla TaxID=520843 RepID=A0ABD1N8R3_9FABA